MDLGLGLIYTLWWKHHRIHHAELLSDTFSAITSSIIHTALYFHCLWFHLPHVNSLLCLYRLFLENPSDGDPLWVFRDCFQGGLDGAVGLVQVVVDDAEVKVVAVGRLDFSALVASPLQLLILRQKNTEICAFLPESEVHFSDLFSVYVESYAACWNENVFLFLYITFLTVSVLGTTPASSADWFIALSTSKSGAWRNTT